MRLTQDSDIQQLLERSKTIAVVGYSDNPTRASHGVTKALQRFGYTVYLVNPTLSSTAEETIYPQLSDIPGAIDIVDIFRRAEFVPEVVEAAIAVGAKAVWMQLGIINEEAAKRADTAGLNVVMDRCIKIEYTRLIDKAYGD